MFYLAGQERELKWNGEVLYRIKLSWDPFDPDSSDDIFNPTNYGMVYGDDQGWLDDYEYLSAYRNSDTFFCVEEEDSDTFIEWMLEGIPCLDREEGERPGYDIDHYTVNEYPPIVADYLLVATERLLASLHHHPAYALKTLFPEHRSARCIFLCKLIYYDLIWAYNGISKENWYDTLEKTLSAKNIPFEEFIAENKWLLTDFYEEFYQKLKRLRERNPEADRFIIGGP